MKEFYTMAIIAATCLLHEAVCADKVKIANVAVSASLLSVFQVAIYFRHDFIKGKVDKRSAASIFTLQNLLIKLFATLIVPRLKGK